jgi:hypothetical protein
MFSCDCAAGTKDSCEVTSRTLRKRNYRNFAAMSGNNDVMKTRRAGDSFELRKSISCVFDLAQCVLSKMMHMLRLFVLTKREAANCYDRRESSAGASYGDICRALLSLAFKSMGELFVYG